MKAWQIPISAEHGGKDRVKIMHYFEVSTDINRMVTAECGTQFNPGFASPQKKPAKKCHVCQQAIAEAT